MSWTDRVLDGDEGSLQTQRAGTVFTLWTVMVYGALVLVAIVVSLVLLQVHEGGAFDFPWVMVGALALLWVLALFGQERYRRRKLEERVTALEANAK